MYKVLVLDAAYQPRYETSFKKAVLLAWKGKVDVLEEVNGIFPSVIRLRKFYNAPERNAKWSKGGVLKRDRMTCVYCGRKITDRKDATVDHIVPKSRFTSGQSASTWTNTACSCWPCNSRKKDRTPEEAGMKLLFEPKTPRARLTYRASGSVPKEWVKYIQI